VTDRNKRHEMAINRASILLMDARLAFHICSSAMGKETHATWGVKNIKKVKIALKMLMLIKNILNL